MECYCNTNKIYHNGNLNYFIWDSKNGWLPALWCDDINLNKYSQTDYTQ